MNCRGPPRGPTERPATATVRATARIHWPWHVAEDATSCLSGLQTMTLYGGQLQNAPGVFSGILLPFPTWWAGQDSRVLLKPCCLGVFGRTRHPCRGPWRLSVPPSPMLVRPFCYGDHQSVDQAACGGTERLPIKIASKIGLGSAGPGLPMNYVGDIAFPGSTHLLAL